jgi:hypothetical protein
MAQTSGAISGVIARVEICFDLSNPANWKDISGAMQSVQSTDQTRNTGEGYTLDGDTAIVTAGKRQPIELEFNLVYSESSTEAFEVARSGFEASANGSVVYVRWIPAGGSAGTNFLFRTPVTGSPAVMSGFRYPPVDASAAGPVMGSFKVKTPSVQKTSANNTAGGSGT